MLPYKVFRLDFDTNEKGQRDLVGMQEIASFEAAPEAETEAERLNQLFKTWQAEYVVEVIIYNRHGVKKLRQDVFEADNYECCYCGATHNLTLDHFVPRTHGGRTIFVNLLTACADCNHLKAGKSLVEAGLERRFGRFRQPTFDTFETGEELLFIPSTERNTPMFIRISRGNFDPNRAAEVAEMLAKSETSLAPAIQKLPGLQFYQTGIDATTGAMIAVSLWDTAEHAAALGTLPEMQAQRVPFQANGIVFEPITTYEILWNVTNENQ